MRRISSLVVTIILTFLYIATRNKEFFYGNSTNIDLPVMKQEQVDNVYSNKRIESPPKKRTVKHILLYTKYFGCSDWFFGVGGPEVFMRRSCPVADCTITYDRNSQKMEDYDAILFHSQNLMYIQNENGNEEDRPDVSLRRPDQAFVVMYYESPMITFDGWQDRYIDYFNWSFTYRYDIGDIVSPYGWISEELGDQPKLFAWKHQKPKLTPERIKFLEKNSKLIGKKWQNQTALALWIVSNCGDGFTKRESYVKELEKYITVDIYGGCNSRKITDVPHDTACQNCFSQIEGKYKFYLAFENSYCDGYITEKFWNSLDANIIPVVRGGANYSEFAPPGSYIDSKDFVTPKLLAEYLHHLDKNKVEYENYFWWKEFYYLNSQVLLNAAGICDVCKKLHDESYPPRVIHNLTQFWTRDDCIQPQNIPL